MQMLNLGLSIFNKVQTMQHRQIKMASELKKQKASQQLSEPQNLSQLISGSNKTITLQNQEI